jgi:hypothetical protein
MTGRQKGNGGPEKGRAPVSIAAYLLDQQPRRGFRGTPKNQNAGTAARKMRQGKMPKKFENDETHVGATTEHHDDGQLRSASHADGGIEDLGVKDMQSLLGTRFV